MIRQKQQETHLCDERRLLGELAGCPWIVQLYRTFEDENNVYILMEYLKGGELFSLLRRQTRLNLIDATFYAAELVCALDSLHARGIVYRDLKPENVLLDRYGHIKLVDMGFAKKVGSKKTGTMCGTPEYLAPEVVRGQGHGLAVDWWSLGVLIYELLAGFSPFSANSIQETYHRIAAGSYAFPDHFNLASRDLISKLLDPSPERRLGSLLGGTADIVNHPFFASTNWVEVRSWTGKVPEDHCSDESLDDTTPPPSPSEESALEHSLKFQHFNTPWVPSAPAFELPPSSMSPTTSLSTASFASKASLFSSNCTLIQSSSTLSSSTDSTAIDFRSHLKLTVEEERKLTWSQGQGLCHNLPSTTTPLVVESPSKISDHLDSQTIAPSASVNCSSTPRILAKSAIHVKHQKSTRRAPRLHRQAHQTRSSRSIKDRFDSDCSRSPTPQISSKAHVPPSVTALSLSTSKINATPLQNETPSPLVSPRSDTSECQLSNTLSEEIDLSSPSTSPDASPRPQYPSFIPGPSTQPFPALPSSIRTLCMSGGASLTTAPPGEHAPPTRAAHLLHQPPFHLYTTTPPQVLSTFSGHLSAASPSFNPFNPHCHHQSVGMYAPTTSHPTAPWTPLVHPQAQAMPVPSRQVIANPPYSQGGHISYGSSLSHFPPIHPVVLPHTPPFVPKHDFGDEDNGLFDLYPEDSTLRLPLHAPECPVSCTLTHNRLPTLVFDAQGVLIHSYGPTKVSQPFNCSER